MKFSIEQFSRKLVRNRFDCGSDVLNNWLKTQAGQQEDRGNTRTFLAHTYQDDNVCGYYSSVIAQVEPDAASQLWGVASRRYPIPAVLIARLAVDKSVQGKGLGSLLLSHALLGAVAISDHAGVEIVVVDALNTDAVAFYRRNGFMSFADSPLRLFVTMKQIKQSLRSL
ncbi:MAG: hypothetical protein RI926_1115 [Actinomycetota bacterium]|jgi:GNAT superfamily N-acetyltransferase